MSNKKPKEEAEPSLRIKSDFITLREVLNTTPQHRDSFLRAIDKGEFPSPMIIVGWTEDMLEGHIEREGTQENDASQTE